MYSVEADHMCTAVLNIYSVEGTLTKVHALHSLTSSWPAVHSQTLSQLGGAQRNGRDRKVLLLLYLGPADSVGPLKP